MQSSDSDNCWTRCQCGRDSPPSSTCRASCLQQTLQPNPCGFSDLENHNCLATDITGTAFDFALGNYSQPDLLASLTESYHPPPPDSLPDLFKNGALGAASDLDIFNDLSHDQSSDAWLALDGAGSAIDGSLDSSPETIFTMMYNESFLAATLNPLAPGKCPSHPLSDCRNANASQTPLYSRRLPNPPATLLLLALHLIPLLNRPSRTIQMVPPLLLLPHPRLLAPSANAPQTKVRRWTAHWPISGVATISRPPSIGRKRWTGSRSWRRRLRTCPRKGTS